MQKTYAHKPLPGESHLNFMNTFECPLSLNISGNKFEQFNQLNSSDNHIFYNLESGQIYDVSVRLETEKCFNISKEWNNEFTYSFNASSEHVSIFYNRFVWCFVYFLNSAHNTMQQHHAAPKAPCRQHAQPS